jgi:hypothetical protein
MEGTPCGCARVASQPSCCSIRAPPPSSEPSRRIGQRATRAAQRPPQHVSLDVVGRICGTARALRLVASRRHRPSRGGIIKAVHAPRSASAVRSCRARDRPLPLAAFAVATGRAGRRSIEPMPAAALRSRSSTPAVVPPPPAPSSLMRQHTACHGTVPSLGHRPAVCLARSPGHESPSHREPPPYQPAAQQLPSAQLRRASANAAASQVFSRIAAGRLLSRRVTEPSGASSQRCRRAVPQPRVATAGSSGSEARGH